MGDEKAVRTELTSDTSCSPAFPINGISTWKGWHSHFINLTNKNIQVKSIQFLCVFFSFCVCFFFFSQPTLEDPVNIALKWICWAKQGRRFTVFCKRNGKGKDIPESAQKIWFGWINTLIYRVGNVSPVLVCKMSLQIGVKEKSNEQKRRGNKAVKLISRLLWRVITPLIPYKW